MADAGGLFGGLLAALTETPTLDPRYIDSHVMAGNIDKLINEAGSDADLAAIRGSMERRGLMVPKELRNENFQPSPRYQSIYGSSAAPQQNVWGQTNRGALIPLNAQNGPQSGGPNKLLWNLQ